MRDLLNIFFNLERRNYEKKVIAQLNIGGDNIITDMKIINEEIENFYCDLLATKLSQDQEANFNNNFEDFTSDLEMPRLTAGEQASQVLVLSLEEILTTVKLLQNNKTPGEDGLTKEFYETFFNLIGKHLLDSYHESFRNGQLSISQRRGVISLIPKEDTSTLELGKWRPITLLNVDYKILARIIGKRIESSLPNIIHSDQTGFIKGGYIGQNVRLLNDLMEYTEVNKLPTFYFSLILKRLLILWNGNVFIKPLKFSTLVPT